MAEEWVIDGYNLLRRGCTKTQKNDVAVSRESLFAELASFAAGNDRQVLAVLDGVGNDAEFRSFCTDAFRILYSQEVSADTYIEHLLAHHLFRENVIAVTDDRAIASLVRGLGARVMGTGEFIKTLERSKREEQNILFEEKVRARTFNRPFIGQLRKKNL